MGTAEASGVAEFYKLDAALRTLALIQKAGFITFFNRAGFAFLTRGLLRFRKELVIALFTQMDLFVMLFAENLRDVVGCRLGTLLALEHCCCSRKSALQNA
jgi:hypothetical protein